MEWNKIWADAHNRKEKNTGVEFWNRKAKHFRKGRELGVYERNFFRLAEIPDKATIFDMGCGAGTLTLPLAAAGHEVYAGDFSPVMLDILREEAKDRGLEDKIHIFHMNWNEDWEQFDIPVCDVAISSRSLIVEDLGLGLKKLASKAKEKVCIVSGTAVSPHINTKLANEIGFKDIPSGNYHLIMQALLDMGIMPRLEYINSDRKDRFDSREDCFEKMSTKYFPRQLTEEELDRLISYNVEHLVQHNDEDGNSYFEYDEVWPVLWAFMSWNKSEQLPADVRALWRLTSDNADDTCKYEDKKVIDK